MDDDYALGASTSEGEPFYQGDMPFGFLSTISSLGFSLTAYLTWAKLTNNSVVCPISGCSNILNSPYAQVGPVPLSALGMLGYGSVAFLSYYSIFIRPEFPEQVNPSRTRSLQVTQQGILYGASVLAGTSAALAFTLKSKFPGEVCYYCAASIAAATTLYLTAYAFSRERRKPWSFGSLAAATLAITGLYTTYPDVVTARSYDVPYNQPAVTQPSPAGAADLAGRLRDAGAKMYGAFWCSHCFEQKQVFGVDAVAALPYVECYPEGYKGPKSINKACTDANVQGFPTWIINGEKVEGDWPLEYLAATLDGVSPKERPGQ